MENKIVNFQYLYILKIILEHFFQKLKNHLVYYSHIH